MSIRFPALLAGLLACGTATAGPLALNSATRQQPDRAVPPQQVAVQGPNLGGGFFEMLFGGPGRGQPAYQPAAIRVRPRSRITGNPMRASRKP